MRNKITYFSKFLLVNTIALSLVFSSFIPLLPATVAHAEDGSELDPWIINDCNDLQAIGSDDGDYTGWEMDHYYVLGNNIDCDEVDFQPIGAYDTDPFTGSLDGNGYSILNLTIVGTAYLGLFSFIDDGSVIDLTFDTGSVTGNSQVGALAGQVNGDSLIDNIQSNLIISGNYAVGGLIGFIGGDEEDFITVSNSSTSGNIIAGTEGEPVDGAFFIGGFVGEANNVEFTESFSHGDISIFSSDIIDYVGGFGGKFGNVIVESSHSEGDIVIAAENEYTDHVGGFAGSFQSSESSVNASSSSGDINILVAGYVDFIGGFTGELSSYVVVTESFATGDIVITSFESVYSVGGFVGEAEGEFNIEDSNAEGDITVNFKNEAQEIGGFAGAVSEEVFLGNISASGDLIISSETEGSSAISIGGAIGLLEGSTIVDSSASGNVNVSFPIFEEEYDDTDVGGFVGTMYESTVENSFATGNVESVGENIGGFVGQIDYGTITDSYATGNVIGYQIDIGGFAGDIDDATVSRSYATGDVFGDSYVGGFVGDSDMLEEFMPTITESFTTGNVTATGDQVGGFVGDGNDLIIRDSYSWGNVVGANEVGGFAGDLEDSVLENVYSIGSVTTDGESIGNFLGYDDGGNIFINSFWNRDTATLEDDCDGSSCEGAEGKTTQELRSLETYPISISGNFFGLQNVEGDAEYRFLKWNILKRKGDSCCIQVAEFIIMLDDEEVEWPEGATAENPDGDYPPEEGPENTIDTILETKWLDFNFDPEDESQIGLSTLIIDVGEGESVTFDGYQWVTANDEAVRDPISWKLYGSNNGNSWNLLDSRSNQSVPNERFTYVPDGSGWDFDEIWGINSTDNNRYPFLRWQGFEHEESEDEEEDEEEEEEENNFSSKRVFGSFPSNLALNPYFIPTDCLPAQAGLPAYKFSPSTGQPCPTETGPTDCLANYLFSPSSGQPCPKDTLLPTPEKPSCTITQTLRFSSRGEEVKCLQTILNGLLVDGIFGSKTKAAVILFQKNNPPLTPDGVVGPMTRARMQ